MSRLIAVSNRVNTVRGAPLVGGLAVALVDALRQQEGLWFGWSGRMSANETPDIEQEHKHGLGIATIDLPAEHFSRYYNGFSNGCLWPLFHCRPDLMHYDREEFASYRFVNRLFARALAPLLRPDDLIWVHDYQLMPLAEELRALGCKQRIGFFLHIPFPSHDLLATLPQQRTILESLLAYDLVGFQTDVNLERWCEAARAELGATCSATETRVGERRVATGVFPAGIDTGHFSDLAQSARAQQDTRRMREALHGRKQIIGVDRLDYSKGLLRRVKAYAHFLDRFPQTHTRIEYLQVTPISRGEVVAYQDFRLELERLSAQINGAHAEFDWTPLRYLNRALSRRTLASLYRASHIGLVTPMRDGMNLVAKEFVAAQDEEDPGVLVLSRFAGAARQMTQAVLVNPYDHDDVAEGIERARTMPLHERRKRHAALMLGLVQDDARAWHQRYLAALRAA